MPSCNQLDDIFTKSLTSMSYDSLGTKLGLFDLYTLAWDIVFYYSRIQAHVFSLLLSIYEDVRFLFILIKWFEVSPLHDYV